MKISMTINGRAVTSPDQIARALREATQKQIDGAIKRAAGPGVRVRKTREGYVAEGSEAQINAMARRLR